MDLLLGFCWREDLMNKYQKSEDYSLNSHLLFDVFSYGVTWLPALHPYKVWLSCASEH